MWYSPNYYSASQVGQHSGTLGQHDKNLHYSLLGSCKMQGVNPYLWLKDVLTRISMHPINKIKELLPHDWKQLQVQDVNSK